MKSETTELTFEERATFGDCPVCFAKHGQPCHPEYGIHLGTNVHGEHTTGVHLGRLNNAPKTKTITYH
jgi:hypothetical protein